MKGDCGVDDLLSDLSFQKWVLHQDAESGLFWEKWVREHPGCKGTVAEATIILKTLKFNESSLSEKESDQLLQRIRYTNASGNTSGAPKTIVRPISSRVEQLQYQQSRRKSTIRTFMGYAAVLATALAFALSIHFLSGNQKKGAGPQLVEKVNNKGQKAAIFLPDGSKVMLNSSSTIRYPKQFSEDVREVYLKGEAFFEVTTGSRPFIVQTDKLAARVLGTSFNVNAFPDSKEHSVSLVTGKVELHPADADQQYLILEPGEKGKIESVAGKLVKTGFDYEEEVGWKEDVLIFKDVPLEEALKRIEKWYGVEFVTDEVPKEDHYVTGRFARESLHNVLLSIGFTAKFKYQLKGNKVYITFHQ
ncbi:Fe2+-dicitrate sensor, membrane protein [Flammeovirgaceae bacterium 311]|nr:Fe2+-dicitrate sensor, membrane protein [Flammeovirgaceae bacterium 311]